MYRIYLCLFISVIFVNLLYLGNANINKIPKYRLCADPTCTAPISEAHGSVPYTGENDSMLSFKKGEKMTIIGKVDNKKHYWTAKIGEKIGFVPQELIKEVRVYHADTNLNHKVPVIVEKEVVNNSAQSSLPETNELEGSLDSSFLLNNATEEPSETPPSYEVVDGTTISLDLINESQDVKPSSTIPADSSTVTHESTAASMISEATTKKTNDITPEEKNRAPEDDEDDEDYDDEDDDEDENENTEEEEDESKGEEATVQTVEKGSDESDKNETLNESSKMDNQIVNENVVETNVAIEAPLAEASSKPDENEESWFDTLSNFMSESQENEVDSSTEKANVSENVLQPEILENVQENLTTVNEIKEEIKIESSTEAAVTTEVPSTINTSTEKNIQESPTQDNDLKENIISNEPVEAKLPEEAKNLTSTSLNVEVEDMTKVVKLLNDSREIPTQEQSQNELPATPTEINNFQPEVPSTFNVPEQTIISSENYRQEDSIPPLLRSFESTTEKTVTDYSPPEKPLDTLKTEEIMTNFIPMTQAAEVQEVTTESYKKQMEAISEGTKVLEELQTENNFEVTPEPIQATVEENSEVVNAESGFFSSLLDTFYGYVGLKQNEEAGIDPGTVKEVFQPDVKDKSEFETVGEVFQEAIPEGNCKTVVDLESNCEDAPLAVETSHHIWDSWYSPSRNMDVNAAHQTTLLYLVITAVTVLLFSLGYYFVEGNRKCSPLIAKVNNLEHQLMVSSAECAVLKDELESTKHKLVLYEDSSNNELVIALQSELKEAQKTKFELEATIESLQQELDSATEAGLDLNRMLSEVLTQKGGSDSLMESVERLQAQLDSQQKIIDDMNTSLVMKNQENEGLQVELASANEKIENLEEELSDIKQNLHMLLKEKEDVTSELVNKNSQLQNQIKHFTENKEKEILALKQNSEDLTKQLKELSDSLILKEGELTALKESVKSIKTQKNFSVDELFNVSRVKAELTKVEKEKSTLKDKLQGEIEARKLLENQIKSTDSVLQKLKESYEEAEKEKIEAQTKLEVLSKYFKEKEMQLQKELGLQEAMWLQKQGDDSTIYERMTSLQGEIDDYKSQNETLKKEILDQERGLKSQIATLEKKAHENWVAARQAERKLEESKQEAAQLRNRLTIIEKNVANESEAKSNHRLNEEINGGETFSPLLHDSSSPMPFPTMPLDPNNPSLLPPGFPPMFIPPPPPMFIPPPPPGGFMPPPPFLPGDRRPPPLGRMSSPPLNNRFSPPSPDYSGDRSPPPLSPSVRNYRSPNESERDRERFRHRTPPFPAYNPRDWEDSHSGGVSGFRPISSQRDSRKDNKGSTLSSGHSSSDSLDKSSRHSGRV